MKFDLRLVGLHSARLLLALSTLAASSLAADRLHESGDGESPALSIRPEHPPERTRARPVVVANGRDAGGQCFSGGAPLRGEAEMVVWNTGGEVSFLRST